MTTIDYKHFLDIAKRHVRVQNEAEDLLQDALIVAIDKGRADLNLEENQKWLAGVIRNLALQEARSAVRRKARNTTYTSQDTSKDETSTPGDEHVASSAELDAQHPILNQLPPAARKVAVLALYGMNRKEICSLLNISDAAFRQRLTSIRKMLAPLSANLRRDLLALAYAKRQSRSTEKGDLPIGIIRNALLRQLDLEQKQGRQALGTHDPSGHLIVISKS